MTPLPPNSADSIRRIHDAPMRAVIAITGGGSAAIASLLEVPGASRTVLEAVVPYSAPALVEFIQGEPEQYCSSHTARQMAMASYRRAEKWRSAERDASFPVVGIGCTASLASDRAKRGPHRIHVAAQSASTTWSWSLELNKGQRSREQEEAVAARLIIGLLAEASGVNDWVVIESADGEAVYRRRTDAFPEWIELLADQRSRTDRRLNFTPPGEPPRIVMPGSFHPLHDGHRQMAAVAAAKLNAPVDFELSIVNVEKPPLDFEEMSDRAAQFGDDVRIWFTRAPRMKQKAALFPGAVFVCGIDTLLRVADAKFASGSEAERDHDLAEIARHGCKFLVFGRTTAAGFETLDDVSIPEALRRICIGVSEKEFRIDISSTELRCSWD